MRTNTPIGIMRPDRHTDEWPITPYLYNRHNIHPSRGGKATATRITFAYTPSGRPHRHRGCPVYAWARVVLRDGESMESAQDRADDLLRRTLPALPRWYRWGDTFRY